jgi:hypothetical protein
MEQKDIKLLTASLLGLLVVAPLLVLGIIHFAAPDVEKSKVLSAPRLHRGLALDQVRTNLQNHTLLHVGGLHRSGTTLIWEALGRHPQVSGLEAQNFTDPRMTKKLKKTYNEGLFLQDCYPKFGLDHDKFLIRKWIGQAAKKIPFVNEHVFSWVRLREGVGRFATDPNNHLDESTPLVANVTQHRLFNQWANYWDLEKPVLLEKSPSNVVISPFLHRLWGLGMDKSPARFIFMRRHPLAVAMATKKAAGPFLSDLDLTDVVENWVLAEERLALDMRQYFEMTAGGGSAEGTIYKILRFEDVVKEPRRTLEELLSWLGLPHEDQPSNFEAVTKKDPNFKYFSRYCMALARHEGTEKQFFNIVERFNERIKLIEPTYAPRDIPKLCKEGIFGEVLKERETERRSEEL